MPSAVDLTGLLHRHTDGVITADDARRRFRYVIDRTAGVLVSPLTHAELDAAQIVLFIPDEGEGAVQLLVEASPIDEGRVTDRWLAYHRSQDAPLWGAMTVDTARIGRDVVDEAISLTCPFAAEEPALCKHANTRRDALASLCASRGVDDRSPVLVGVDVAGVHIRARTRIVRVDFPEPVSTAAAARAALDALLDAPGEPA